jgi:hypothetical protein
MGGSGGTKNMIVHTVRAGVRFSHSAHNRKQERNGGSPLHFVYSTYGALFENLARHVFYFIFKTPKTTFPAYHDRR